VKPSPKVRCPRHWFLHILGRSILKALLSHRAGAARTSASVLTFLIFLFCMSHTQGSYLPNMPSSMPVGSRLNSWCVLMQCAATCACKSRMWRNLAKIELHCFALRDNANMCTRQNIPKHFCKRRVGLGLFGCSHQRPFRPKLHWSPYCSKDQGLGIVTSLA